MRTPNSAVFGAVFSAALALGAGSAWSAQEKDSNTVGTAASGAPAPATETVLTAPVTSTQVQPAAAPTQPVTEQRAGMAKPIKVYWYLSGR